MKNWSEYTSIKQFEDLAKENKKRELKAAIYNMVCGAGLALFVYIFVITFLSM